MLRCAPEGQTGQPRGAAGGRYNWLRLLGAGANGEPPTGHEAAALPPSQSTTPVPTSGPNLDRTIADKRDSRWVLW